MNQIQPGGLCFLGVLIFPCEELIFLTHFILLKWYLGITALFSFPLLVIGVVGGGAGGREAAKFKVGFRDIDLKELFRRSRGGNTPPSSNQGRSSQLPFICYFWQKFSLMTRRDNPLYALFPFDFILLIFYFIKSIFII